VWDRLAAVLESDIAHRARRLAEAGPLGAFADLHPDVSWRGGALRVRRAYTASVELDGRGLLLLPAVFVSTAWTMIDPPWQPTIAYAPRGAELLWAPTETSGALAELLGRRRAAILDALAVPATTHELARTLRASPAGVSEHLGVLRRSGLVAGRRDGRAVRYARTAAGEALLRAPATTV
jgi:DNA-binding transcriptional ArsR family regulator